MQRRLNNATWLNECCCRIDGAKFEDRTANILHFKSVNKHVEQRNSVISEQSVAKPTEAERLTKNNKRKKRRKI